MPWNEQGRVSKENEYDSPKYGGCGEILHTYNSGMVEYCGGTGNDGYVFCPQCEQNLREKYPQGWDYYPGDICRHGTYTGGSGIDYMCFHCEMGEEEEEEVIS